MSLKNLMMLVLEGALAIGVVLNGACAGQVTVTRGQEIPSQSF